MYIITIILTGVAVGALVRLAIGGPSFGSILMTTTLGAAGALLAGLIGRWLGFSGMTHPLLAVSFAFFGAAAVLSIHRLLLARRALL